MRLNRTTILLLLGLLVIIAASALLSNNDNGADDTPATSGTTLQLFEDVAASTVTSLTITSVLDPAAVPAEAVQPEVTAEPDAEATAEATTEPEPESVTVTLALALDEASIWTTTADSLITSSRSVMQDNISSTLNTLLGLRSSDQFQPENGDLAPFGLDNPTHEISFTAAAEEGAEPASYRLRLGGKNPAGVNYYALFGDDDTTVYVITSASALDNNVLDLVTAPPFVPEPTPTPVPVLNVPGPIFSTLVTNDIVHLSVTNNATGDQFAATLGADNLWTEDGAAEGSPQLEPMLIFLALNGFSSLNAVDGITTDNLEPLGLTEPAYTISVETNSGQVVTLHTGGQDPTGTRTYALVEGFDTVVVLDSTEISTLTGMIEFPPYMPEAAPEATTEATAEATAEATESSN